MAAPVEIRSALPDDCQQILLLIRDLAAYEKMPNGPKLDEKTFREDGFGDKPFYNCFVATITNETGSSTIVGYALYFFVYSTWEGRSIYMEDLYVKPELRHQGIGTRLWKRVAEEAVRNNCKRLDFSVLNWNQSSIDFYKKIGAVNKTEEEGWNLFRMSKDVLQKFAESQN